MISNIFYTATYNLGGVGGFRDESYTGLDWLNSPTFTEDELNTEMSRLQTEYDSQEYARARAAEYSALNQFEMQFDDQQNNTTTWVDAINDIKAAHPKP
jgi:hypothetical protein